MKQISLLWLKMALMGIFLTSYAYAASLEEEARKAVIDYFLSRKMIAICGESFYFSTYEQNGLHRCEVCMDFQRGAICRTAVSTDVNTATLTARDTACDFLVHSTAEEIACSQTPPARVTCSEQKAEELGQGKEFYITIHQGKLSNAEKRRSIQWKGTGSLDAKAVRTYSHNTWSPWRSPVTEFHVTILKEKGSWIVQPNSEIKTVALHNEFMDCKSIESGTK
jgi:hypothetical protein